MSLGKDLRQELEILVSMIPIWRRHEEMAHRVFMLTKQMDDFQTYVDARFKVIYMEEKVDFINGLLRNNPNE
jgi:hypothetical protein